MSEDEVYEMQCKIDEGIYLAQKRLVERAKHNHTTLIIAREGQVVEVKAEELYPILPKSDDKTHLSGKPFAGRMANRKCRPKNDFEVGFIHIDLKNLLVEHYLPI